MQKLLFAGLGALLLAGCGSKWTVADAKFFKYQNKDVRVAAKVMLNQKEKPRVGSSDGVDFQMRLYSAEYKEIIGTVEGRAGEHLEKEGTVNIPEIFVLRTTDYRLGGTPNSYPDFCAEVRMDHSNIDNWLRIGCVNFNDTPSESPTGGMGAP